MSSDDKQLWTLYGQYLGARVVEAVQDGSKLAGLAQPDSTASGFEVLTDCLVVFQSVNGLPQFDLTPEAVEAAVLKQDDLSNDHVDWLNSWLDAFEAWEAYLDAQADDDADDGTSWAREHSTMFSAAHF
jgi:hypothetical protein